MRSIQVIKRSLLHYWRTHLAVVGGVAVSIAVLTGALLVGDSVRNSLKNLFLDRLGNTDQVIVSSRFFRELLANELQDDADFGTTFRNSCPLIVKDGMVTHESSGRRRSGVSVYGVDQRFWKFHGIDERGLDSSSRSALLTSGLAEELKISPGESILLRIKKPSDLPSDSLHGDKTNIGRTIRLRSLAWTDESFDFSLVPNQDLVRAVFVPLERLQRDLDRENGINTILLSSFQQGEGEESQAVELVRRNATLADLGVSLRWMESSGSVSIESDTVVLSQSISRVVRETAADLDLQSVPILTYLANSIRLKTERNSETPAIPYSLVSAMDDDGIARISGLDVSQIAAFPDEYILLNQWAAQDLGAREGDWITLEYYLWEDSGRLVTRSADFQLVKIVKLEGSVEDPDLAPVFPGLTETKDLSSWDPPFPIDLDRIRTEDEDYWDQYRTTPKGFISLNAGQELWSNRFGNLTSIRLYPVSRIAPENLLGAIRSGLLERLDPLGEVFAVHPVRSRGLSASKGATDFGEYFVYFSFFLVVSALLLTALFFRLGVEQRYTEIGILQAVGFSQVKIRNLFLIEAALLACLGTFLGLAGALLYGEIIMHGLRSWWIDAVGTRLLSLHVNPVSLLLGAIGGLAASWLGITWTLRSIRAVSARSLLMGHRPTLTKPGLRNRYSYLFAGVSFIVAVLLLATSLMGWVSQVVGFFGAGTLLLVASLFYLWTRLSGRKKSLLRETGLPGILKLGFRSVSYRPGRSLLSVSLIAFASFTLIAVDAFRRDERNQVLKPDSGNGGFPLIAESLLPLVWNPNSPEGREELDLDDSGPQPLQFYPFRVRPGDDSSCFNLYRPQNPRIIAPVSEFIHSGRFVFTDSVATTAEERKNPWLLLNRVERENVIPVIGDANSMAYVLHLGLGEEFELPLGGGGSVRLRLVGTLYDSLFQGELLMSEENFMRLFPEHQGFRLFLIDSPADHADMISEELERRLSDFGFDVSDTLEKLSSFHRVENTYLSTFQTLGGLGLILGTFGLAVVMLRNVLERRFELALLQSVGFTSRNLFSMIIAENAVLLFWGLVIGAFSALISITPALISRGESFSLALLSLFFLLVLLSGLLASLLAITATVRTPLLQALRSE